MRSLWWCFEAPPPFPFDASFSYPLSIHPFACSLLSVTGLTAPLILCFPPSASSRSRSPLHSLSLSISASISSIYRSPA